MDWSPAPTIEEAGRNRVPESVLKEITTDEPKTITTKNRQYLLFIYYDFGNNT